jgi:ATP-dependent RNA helicase DeaD
MQKNTFSKLGVNSDIVRALSKCGITEPTDIQEQAIPIIKSGKDIIGKSKTGSGKTAAFGIPLLDSLKHSSNVQALVLAPTRELAVQISGELEKFGKYTDLKFATVYGGVSMFHQIRDIKKADIVIGTPGRVLDHLNRKTLKLSELTHFVLDEADRMVDMGFIKDIEKILRYTKRKKQMILFGATISHEVELIKRKYMNNPFVAESEIHVAEEYLEQYYYNVQKQKKFSLLVHLLNVEQANQVIVFCSSIRTVELIAKNLKAQKIKSGMLHGKMNQNKRMRAIKEFNNGNYNILVASPVAARGLDIKNISHIFNYDLSKDPQEYVHRVGRTARAGESGKAFTLLSSKDHPVFRQILQDYDLNIQEVVIESFPRVDFDVSKSRQRNNGFRGQRSRSRGPRRTNARSNNSRSPRRFGNSHSRSNDSKPSEGRSRGPRRFGNNHSRSNYSKPAEGRSRGPGRFGNRRSRRPGSSNHVERAISRHKA